MAMAWPQFEVRCSRVNVCRHDDLTLRMYVSILHFYVYSMHYLLIERFLMINMKL